MTDVPHFEDESSSTARRLHEALIKFEPSEELDELLSAFLNDMALRKRGDKAIELSLLMEPYRYGLNDRSANGFLSDNRRKLKNVLPRSLLVGKDWTYSIDANSEREATHMRVAMRIGGTAAERAIAKLPLLRNDQLPLAAVVDYNYDDLLAHEELTEARLAVEQALAGHTMPQDVFASGFYQVLRPKLVTRPVENLRLVNGSRS